MVTAGDFIGNLDEMLVVQRFNDVDQQRGIAGLDGAVEFAHVTQTDDFVEVDDFIISLRSFQGGIEYSRYKGLCSPAYIVLRKNNKNLCSDFYRIYFKSFNYIQELNKKLEGIRDGKMISYKQFSEIKLPVPSLPEQQKIASCLSSLDEGIAAQQRKVEALKEHKKGLMQKLFPICN